MVTMDVVQRGKRGSDMKKKMGISVIITVILLIVLFAFSKNPIVSCNIEIPESYMGTILRNR